MVLPSPLYLPILGPAAKAQKVVAKAEKAVAKAKKAVAKAERLLPGQRDLERPVAMAQEAVAKAQEAVAKAPRPLRLKKRLKASSRPPGGRGPWAYPSLPPSLEWSQIEIWRRPKPKT